MSSETKKSLQDLERENRRLSEENESLKDKLDGKCGRMMNDTVDGIVFTIVILAIATGVVLWLNGMAS